jgi:hypothetical protein
VKSQEVTYGFSKKHMMVVAFLVVTAFVQQEVFCLSRQPITILVVELEPCGGWLPGSMVTGTAVQVHQYLHVSEILIRQRGFPCSVCAAKLPEKSLFYGAADLDDTGAASGVCRRLI